MIEIIIDTLRQERGEAVEIARSIPEDRCGEMVAGLPQTPAWIMSHLHLADLRMTTAFGGTPARESDPLMAEFGPGSPPEQAAERMRASIGDWPTVIDAAIRSHRALLECVARVDDALLDGPNPREESRAWFPTPRHTLVYMIRHEGNHVGQLRAWRHAARHAGRLDPT